MMKQQEVVAAAENNMVLGGVMIKDEMAEMNLCGTDDHFFDHIDDFLDFPMEDIEEESLPPPQDVVVGGGGVLGASSSSDGGGGGDLKGNVWPLQPGSSSNQNTTTTTTSELPSGLSHPYEDFPPLEWMSSFIDDSFSARSCVLDKDPITIDNKNNIINHNQSSINYHQFQSSSPVSVLETNSSYSGGKPMPLQTETFARGRARSKRPRPATFNPRPMIPLISPTTSTITDTATTTSSELVSEIGNYADSRPKKKIMSEFHGIEKKNTKKKQQKKLPPLPGGAMGQSVRKCLHCEITKTPQWRAGPLGPKTLCNACGVRFKSGRLYPEYRPAASPTFVAAMHSNSHKKVLEMRIRGCEQTESPLIATRFPFQPVPFG